jgi:hypothetical protein
MPRELFPSSYECDCGHQSHFFERTIREIKAMSMKRKQFLSDSEPQQHTIVFSGGKMMDIICPNRGKREQASSDTSAAKALKSRASRRARTTRKES